MAYGIPVGLTAMIYVININIDKYMVGLFFSSSVFAAYYSGSLWAPMFGWITQSASQVVTPPTSSAPGFHPTEDSKTVIDYLMRENVSLKQELESLKAEIVELKTPSPKDNLLDKIVADSLLICGRVTDGIITEVDGRWKDILGYDDDQLVGHRYDRADLIHPDELKRVWRIQEKLKGTETITESRYCTIQRWKHGHTGDYVMLSMVWDVNVTENTAIVICKPIDRFIDGRGELN